MQRLFFIVTTMILVCPSFTVAQEKPGKENETVEQQEHLTYNRGWKNAMPGEEINRGQKVTRVAITRVEIKFDDQKKLPKFLAMMRQSAKHLRNVPNKSALYDLQMIMVKDKTVRFGVAWYDDKFFVKNREVEIPSMNKKIATKYGVKPKNIRVEHVVLQQIAKEK